MPDKILVTGATGNIGGDVLRQLAALGLPVRALVRNPDKARNIKLPNVEIVQGDLGKPETLAPALEGVQRALLVSSPEPRQTELQRNFIDAAKQAQLRQIVKISAMGSAPDSIISFGRWHAEIDRYLAQSGVPFTILQPNFFMQNTFSFVATIAKESKFYGSMKDGKVGMVDVRDIAAVAAQTLIGAGHEGKTYIVTGPEALSFTEVARKLSAGLGKTVTYVDLPREALVQALGGLGLPEWQAQGIADVNDWVAQGGGALITDVVARIGKTQPIPFDQFARDFPK